MAMLHLISGLPCSGKTTYAVGLRPELDGVLFSLDRWLITIFGRYQISSVGHQEHTRRVLACRELIWESASELLRRGVAVILDDGFFLRDHRMRHISFATGFGVRSKIHYVTAPIHVIRGRLDTRNAHLPVFNFFIDPATLDGFRGLFEPPTGDEGAEIVVVSASGEGPWARIQ